LLETTRRYASQAEVPFLNCDIGFTSESPFIAVVPLCIAPRDAALDLCE
jgi:hypothetical protein